MTDPPSPNSQHSIESILRGSTHRQAGKERRVTISGANQMTCSQYTSPGCYNASITTSSTLNIDEFKDSSHQAPSGYAFSTQRGISQCRSQYAESLSVCSVTIKLESVDLVSFDLLFAVLCYSIATYSFAFPHVVVRFLPSPSAPSSPRRVPSFSNFVHIISSST